MTNIRFEKLPVGLGQVVTLEENAEESDELDERRAGQASSAVSKGKRRRYGPPRTVCLNCHSHKLKCDKKRPSCLHCSRRKKKCIYADDGEEEEEGQSTASSSKLLSRRSSSSPEMKPVVMFLSSSEDSDLAGKWSNDRSDSQEQLRNNARREWLHFKAATQRDGSDSSNSISLRTIPTNDYISHNWFDHLLSFFGPNKTKG
jgi:hypothetical protein